MADFPDSAKRQLGYFHGLSKVPTESTQYVYESKYKSAHSVLKKDIWADDIAYAPDVTAADNEALSNPAVTKYTKFSLTMIPGSNGQSWYINDGGKFVRPLISPIDIPNILTNNPSDGYQLLLYKDNDTLITPTEGAWVVDYYSGIIKFAEGYTPTDLGYGTPKVTCYVYTGNVGIGSISTEEVENHILSSLDISNKYITLNNIPIDEEKLLVFVDEGLKGLIGEDYILSSNQINWSGKDWDGILSIGDVLTVVYWY